MVVFERKKIGLVFLSSHEFRYHTLRLRGYVVFYVGM